MSQPVLRPPPDIFARRAARLLQLADGHAMAGFLVLCAAICQQQQALHDASRLDPRAALEKLAQALEPQLPAPVQAALVPLLALDAAALSRLAERLINGDYPADGPCSPRCRCWAPRCRLRPPAAYGSGRCLSRKARRRAARAAAACRWPRCCCAATAATPSAT
ncbi:formate dehydrogenase accessory protein FdhE domain-containing protein [Chromobacterium vaccinii]